MKLHPKCLSNEFNPISFMSSDGLLLPCCFLNPEWARSQLKPWLEERGGSLDDFIYDTDVETVKSRKGWSIIMSSIDSYETAFSECKKLCGQDCPKSNDNVAMHNILEIE